MARPQQPELSRSGSTPIDPDSLASEAPLQHRAPADEGVGGPVPEDNLPGHHPEHEQDKPDAEAFLRKARGDDRPAAPQAEAEGAPEGDDERQPDPWPVKGRLAAAERLASVAGFGPRLAGQALRAIRRRL